MITLTLYRYTSTDLSPYPDTEIPYTLTLATPTSLKITVHFPDPTILSNQHTLDYIEITFNEHTFCNCIIISPLNSSTFSSDIPRQVIGSFMEGLDTYGSQLYIMFSTTMLTSTLLMHIFFGESFMFLWGVIDSL